MADRIFEPVTTNTVKLMLRICSRVCDRCIEKGENTSGCTGDNPTYALSCIEQMLSVDGGA